MDIRVHLLRPDARATPAYARATTIFIEKRELLLNRELRELSNVDADAVAAARIDVPFRGTPGRQKRNG
jgi:hypothetical protein